MFITITCYYILISLSHINEKCMYNNIMSNLLSILSCNILQYFIDAHLLVSRVSLHVSFGISQLSLD